LVLTGSHWIGIPPRDERGRYEQARQLVSDGTLRLESLITGYCDLDGVLAAFEDHSTHRTLKTVLLPGGTD
jgi:threonine dehydrogenase-like Zn-dependent dehydrogenase